MKLTKNIFSMMKEIRKYFYNWLSNKKKRKFKVFNLFYISQIKVCKKRL